MNKLMNEHSWTMEGSLNASYIDINNFTIGLHRALSSKEKSVAINMSQAAFINGELSPLLLLGIRQLQSQHKSVRFVGVKPAQKDIFERNGLYETIGFTSKPDTKNTTITVREFHVSSTELIDHYLNDHLIPKIKTYSQNAPSNEQASVDEMIGSATYATEELVDNIKTHSESELMYFAGQFFPRQKRISFTILDAGLTIPAIVRNAFASSQNKEALANVADYRLIQWATEQGNTTKNVKESGVPGGAGLYTVKTSLENHGELTIVSGGGFWKLTSSGKILQQNLFPGFPGTLVHVTFILDSNTIDKANSPLSLLF